MRILYITQYFVTPDQPGSLRHYAHAKEWARRGHDVVVLSTFVLHKNAEIPAKYRGAKLVTEEIEGCTVRKVYSRPSFTGFRGRMANYLSFMWQAICAGLREKGTFDIVMASSPSLFAALAGLVVAWAKRVPFVLEVRDLWPASAIATGHLKSKYAIWIARLIEKCLYARASAIICVTEGIAEAVRSKTANAKSIVIVPNGVDTELFQYKEAGSQAKMLDYLDEIDQPIALYAGSHGKNNALDTVIASAKLMNNERIHFVLIGEGDQTEELRFSVINAGLHNVTFLGALPRQDVPPLLCKAAVLLWPVFWETGNPVLRNLKAGVVPNKLYDYVASGRPIVTSVPRPSEAFRRLEEWSAAVVYSDPNAEAFSAAIRNALNRTPMSDTDRRVFLDGYARIRGAEDIMRVLQAVVGDP